MWTHKFENEFHVFSSKKSNFSAGQNIPTKPTGKKKNPKNKKKKIYKLHKNKYTKKNCESKSKGGKWETK